MDDRLPAWRSLLFIPANNRKFVAEAHSRGADAIILDLEDSVAPEQKASSRLGVPSAAEQIFERGTDVLVRVNAEYLDEDINACTTESVSAFVLPKVEDSAAVLTAAAILDAVEEERGLLAGRVKLIAQIEDVSALPRLDEIATCSSRLIGMNLGSEDFAVSANMQPVSEILYWPNQQVAFACRRANILPFGFPASISLFEDTELLSEAVHQAAKLGMVGAFCIHPKQVSILNKILTPSPEDVADARTLLAEFAKAESEGNAVLAHKGKMVDLPVVMRARELVARSEAIERRNRAGP